MIFVTGGTGLVGAHLLYRLTSAGKKVKALKRRSSNLQQVLQTFAYYSENSQQLFDQIEWVDGDILDYFSLEKLLKDVTEIYHCAAIISFETKERKRMISNNVEGSANLVNAAIENGVRKLCHVSSIAALGRLDDGLLVTEETNWVPAKKISGYSESKFFSETEIWRGMEEGLEAVIVNPSIILGPANWETGSAKMFKTIWDGMKFYTKGITGFVGVNDVAKAMVQVMEESNFEACKNQRFILNAENLSYQTVFNTIATEFDKPKPSIFASNFLLGIVWRAVAFVSWLSGKPSLITRDSVSNSNSINNFDGRKITRTLDFQYSSVAETIKTTASFFKNDLQK